MIGSRLAGRYEIRAELGRGGMGVVYLAHDETLDREVAAKVITPALLSQEAEQRFRREARVIARMDHPAVVTVYDVGEHEGALFFVMPYVQGANLRQLLQENTLLLAEVMDVGIQVAEALDYSHSLGVIHRDIKPENIMVSRDRFGTPRVRITDFGLAMESSEARLTRSGSVVGTIAYLSPEHLSGKEVDHRSDIYSLGTVLYECFTGETPFSGELQHLLYRIANEVPQSLRSRGVELPKDLEEILLRCLEKDPKRRYDLARDFAADLIRVTNALPRESLQRPVTSFKSAMPSLRPDRSRLSALIGREKEFQELQRRLNTAALGECQFVLISGEAGIGKSRLLEEMESLAAARKILVLRGRFVEQDRAFPYQGFCEVIQEYFRIRAAAPADFSDLAQDLVNLFPVLSEIPEFKISGSIPKDQPMRKLEDRVAIFEVLARTVSRMGSRNPLVILLEDLHAADVSIEALQHMIHRLSLTPTLIAASYRYTEVDRRHPLSRMIDSLQGDRRFLHLRLNRFDAGEHRAFLETILGTAHFDQRLCNAVYEATEGNPYFTRELIQSLIDSRGIVHEATGWNLQPGNALTVDQLPATIQQTVEKRIERLPDRLRDVLSVASVLGRVFEFRDLQVLQQDHEKLEEDVEQLIRAGFIEEDRRARGERLAFSSGVIRDVLYGYLSRRRRKSLHRKIAEEIERSAAGKARRRDAVLFHHYTEGDVPEKVLEVGLRLCSLSLDTFGADEALRAARTVLEFLDEDVPEHRPVEAEVRTMLASAYRMGGNMDSALRELERAIRIYESLQRQQDWLRAVVMAADTAWEGRQVQEAERWVEAGLEAARKAGAADALSRLLSLGMTAANLRGDTVLAREYFDESERLGHTTPQEAEIPAPGPQLFSGRVTVPLAGSIENLDPSLAFLVIQSEVMPMFFETLTREAEGARIAPWLASEIHADEGGKRFFFRLHEDIRFHDGRRLTSLDVRYSFERLLRNRNSASRFLLSPIRGGKSILDGNGGALAGFHVQSPTEFAIELEQPVSFFPALLAHTSAAIVPEGWNPDYAGDAAGCIGTGPFRVARFEPGTVLELEANRHYWRSGCPKCEQLTFHFGISPREMIDGFRSGAFTVARDLFPQDVDALRRDAAFHARYGETPRLSTYYVVFNSRGGPLADESLRRRILQAVDVDSLVRRHLGRLAVPAHTLIPPGLLGYEPHHRLPEHPEEHPAASQEIPLTAIINSVYEGPYSALASEFLLTLREQGFNVRIAYQDRTEYDRALSSGSVDLVITRWVADYPDADSFVRSLLHSEEGILGRLCGTHDVDTLIAEARAETDPHKRHHIYSKVENILQSRALMLPLFHEQAYCFARPETEGFEVTYSTPLVAYEKLWIPG